MSEFILVMTTVPDEEAGKSLAENIVSERLAACATLISAALSFYWWQGSVARDREFVLFIKTRKALFSKLAKRIEALHPYEVPEIVALPILQGSKAYLDWLEKETRE